MPFPFPWHTEKSVVHAGRGTGAGQGNLLPVMLSGKFRVAFSGFFAYREKRFRFERVSSGDVSCFAENASPRFFSRFGSSQGVVRGQSACC